MTSYRSTKYNTFSTHALHIFVNDISSPTLVFVLYHIHRVSIKHLLQKNHVEYKHIFLPLLKLVSKILCHVFNVTFGFWMQYFQTGGLGEMVRHPGHHDRRISPPLTSFYGGMLRTKCFRHQLQILQI